jgi:MFS family permease
MFSFWREADPVARRTLIAASLGWMLDAFDVWIYALVLTSVKADLSLSAATAGGLQGLTLLASALGGIAFGLVANRWGRVRALMVSVLLYSVFTAACGLAQTALQLALFRVGLGIGMGGEWASGAALVSETWKPEHRNRAMAFMQSAWAVGLGLAALVNWLVQDVAHLNWRAVFLVGIAPALFAWWVRRRVPEPAAWHASRARGERVSLGRALAAPGWGITIALILMNACTMFGVWGFNTWVPSYLKSPAVGLTNAQMNGFLMVMQVGMWFGYVLFGYLSDAFGRKRVYVSYLRVRGADRGRVRVDDDAVGAARAGADHGILRDRLLQRVRRGDGRVLSDRGARDGAGLHLQPRAYRLRGRTVPARQPDLDARLRLRVERRGRRVCDRGAAVVVHPRRVRTAQT